MKGKESENSYQELKRSQGTGTHKHTETESRYFDWHDSDIWQARTPAEWKTPLRKLQTSTAQK